MPAPQGRGCCVPRVGALCECRDDQRTLHARGSNRSEDCSPQPLVLPCAQLWVLTRLDLSAMRVEMQLPLSALADSSILPKLRELCFRNCSINMSQLQQLQLPSVTRLDLTRLAVDVGTPQLAGTDAAPILMRCLPQLQQLTLTNAASSRFV